MLAATSLAAAECVSGHPLPYYQLWWRIRIRFFYQCCHAVLQGGLPVYDLQHSERGCNSWFDADGPNLVVMDVDRWYPDLPV